MDNNGDEDTKEQVELPPNETEERKVPEREPRKRYTKLASFGLPESSYDIIRSIIRAMGKLGGAGTQLANQEIAQTAGLGERTISINNRFLLSTGIANKSGNSISLSERGGQLALALDYNDAEESSRVWRSIAAGNDFLMRVLGALDIQDGKNKDDCASFIAKSAGAPNEPQFIRGGMTVIDVLLDSGLVMESESGKIVVTPQYRTIGAAGPAENEPTQAEQRKDETEIEIKPRIETRAAGLSLVVNINVAITAGMSDEEFQLLSERVMNLRDKLQ